MYKVNFYRTSTGFSDIESLLDSLSERMEKSKDARIQFEQITRYIQFLSDHGTRLGEDITKHLDGAIWELRPGNNRILFFYFDNDTFVLLHHFRKKTRKTPRREITRAQEEMEDWIIRKGNRHE